MHRTMPLVLGLLLAACGESSVGSVEASCVAGVNVDGTTFTSGGPHRVEPEDVGDVYMEVSVYTGCQDEGVVRDGPWEPGVSNFLAVGTQLHRVDGFEPRERLTHWSDVIDEWLPLIPLPQG